MQLIINRKLSARLHKCSVSCRFIMKVEDFKLICIKDDASNTWIVYHSIFTGLIVQVEDLKDAPKEIAKSFEVMLKYGFDKEIHELHTLSTNGS